MRGLELSQKMPRKRTEAAPAKTGRTWSPIKGLTMTERGPLQVHARVRRTGRPSQTKTFESVAEAIPVAHFGSRGKPQWPHAHAE